MLVMPCECKRRNKAVKKMCCAGSIESLSRPPDIDVSTSLKVWAGATVLHAGPLWQSRWGADLRAGRHHGWARAADEGHEAGAGSNVARL